MTDCVTSNRLYDVAEADYLKAVEEYSRGLNRRMTATDHFAVMQRLGYQRPNPFATTTNVAAAAVAPEVPVRRVRFLSRRVA